MSATEDHETHVQNVVRLIQENFETFGGDRKPSGFNPLENWLEGKPAVFALGVPVEEVVRFVLAQDVEREARP